jgi:hypothetical protein
VTGGGGGGCTQAGNPCSGGSNCCSRTCFDPGSGATVCLPAGGCHLTGTNCANDNECCGGGANPNGSVQCSSGRCDNGQSCNGVGNICGAPVLRDGGSINASQNCCNGMKDVCKLDSSGIPRCFGGASGSCPKGYTGQAGCCIASGATCQFKDQCCNGQLCLPDDAGVSHCGSNVCTGTGSACTTNASCCNNSCVAGFCRVATVDAGVSDAGTLCTPNNQTCQFSGQCCSNICQNGMCTVPNACQPQGTQCTASADCCSGLSCGVGASGTGTCQVSACLSPGQTCAAGSNSCCAGLECDDLTTGVLCGSSGKCACFAPIN